MIKQWLQAGLVTATATAIALCACSGPLASGGCTSIGVTEGVSVQIDQDLAQGTPDRTLDVCVVDTGACDHRAASDATGELPGLVATDLTSAPVTVTATVRDGGGAAVYTGSGTAAPDLIQPNGPRCDGKGYVLLLRADADGKLTKRPALDSNAP